MPFLETYAVNLAGGNLHPHLNLRNWPDLQLDRVWLRPQLTVEIRALPQRTGTHLRHATFVRAAVTRARMANR